MKKVKKLSVMLSLILCFSMIFSGSVFAESINSPVCISSKNYNEIKNPNDLINLAIEQNNKLQKNFNTKSLFIEDNSQKGENNELQCTQLLNEKKYSDGSMQKDFVFSTISLSDDYYGGTHKYNDYAYNDGLTVITNLYASARIPSDAVGTMVRYHIDKGTALISKTGTHGSMPKTCEIGYNMHGDCSTSIYKTFTCKNVDEQTFKVIPSDRNYYEHDGPGQNMFVQTVVTQTSGDEIVAIACIPSEFYYGEWTGHD